MSATIYQQANVAEPTYRIGETVDAGHYVVVHLDGHHHRLQTTDADDLDGLALVLMEAAAALRSAQAEGAR